jgi:hypothetical protein
VEDRIRELAYQKWLDAGCPPGDGVNFWCDAEAELNGDGETKSSKKVAAAAVPQKIAAKTSKGTR